MKYKGKELKEITTPQVFDPPKELLVWDDEYDPVERTVYAVIRTLNGTTQVVSNDNFRWNHCAEIPKSRRATNRELAKWLAQGNGETTNEGGSGIFSLNGYEAKYENTEVVLCVKVRKWEDTDWHEPTVDYMGIK